MLTEATVSAIVGRGTTFAGITTVTKVATAAAHKAVAIQKITNATVQLFGTVSDAKDMYARAVRKSAKHYENNNAAAVENFVTSAGVNEHDANCYSIVRNNNTGNIMLYARYLRSRAVYKLNGETVSKATVALYLTKSAADALLNPKESVHNVLNGVEHNVRIATPSLKNITELRIRKQILK